jgi:hypothetical protein
VTDADENHQSKVLRCENGDRTATTTIQAREREKQQATTKASTASTTRVMEREAEREGWRW